MTRQDLMPDRLGSYRLLKRIGEGGMGVVFLARSPGQQSVALKVLRSSVAGEATARQRLAREVETMQRVRSPHVAEVIDADLAGDMPYIVTRYVPGRTLDEVVGEGGPITGPALARLACGLADALVAVHAAGVVHRDLKPSNVMLLDGSPVVIDFGIAQGPDATRLTMTGMFMGTPGYLAPEVIEGQPSSQASDVHAWGATVAFAATGRPPYGTGSYEGIFYRIVNGQPDLTAVPAALLSLLSAALARNPALRPSALHLAAQARVLDPAALTPPPVIPAAGAGLPDVPGFAAGLGGITRADPPLAGGPSLAGQAAPAGGLAGAPPAANGTTWTAAAPPGPLFPPRPATLPVSAGQRLPGGLAGMLPPVKYHPGGVAPQQPAVAVPESGAAARGARGRRLLVWASMVAAAAVSVILPIVGTLISVAAIVTLRAAGLAQRRRAERRLARGSRPTDTFVATVSFPWFLLRALAATLLLAPFALAAAALAAVITVVLAPLDWPARALAYGAGALVLFYGFGPGSKTARTQLMRVFARTATTRTAHVVALAGLTALAIAALAAAVSWPSVYWPAFNPGRFLHTAVIHWGPLHHFRLLPQFGLTRRITLFRRLLLHRIGQVGILGG